MPTTAARLTDSGRTVIISASYRTDIPAFYGDWFQARLEAGFCRVANPYGGPESLVRLDAEAVQGFVFWTRNSLPFTPVLEALSRRGTPFVVQYTITGYPRPLERSVIEGKRAIAAVRELARRYGPKAVVWRYDPVFLTSLTPPAWHLSQFERLADELAGACDEVVLSFAQIYAKTRRNSERAARDHGFTWWDAEPEVKATLLTSLAETARQHGMTPSLCSQPDLLSASLTPARCIDGERLSAVAGRSISARIRGNRPGCLCAQSKDIGAYDTCAHGCVYCYAVRSQSLGKRKQRAHDPVAERLG
ncbi:MAG: DUF1848 domain-containing protein [Pseudomonadota bacterium]